MEELTCQKCGVVQTDYKKEIQKFENGTTHVRAICSSCDKFIKFVRDEGVNPANPMSIMHYGKHKGKTFMSIAVEDYDYALWCCENLSNKKDRANMQLAMESL